MKKRFSFYLGVYFFAAVIAVIGLFVNIKTESLNEKNQKLSIQLKKIKEENTKLQIKLIQTTTLVKTEKIASENLNMKFPEKINYLVIED